MIDLSNYKAGPLVAIVLVVYMPFILLQNSIPQGEVAIFGPFGILVFVLRLYDKYLWKIPLLSQSVKCPNISGTYKGAVVYGKDEGKSCEMTIHQTASKVIVECSFSKESENNTKSESKIATFYELDGPGNPSLLIYYENRGSGMSGDSLEQHNGTNTLKIITNQDGITLEGEYYTNREPQTKGLIKVSKVKEGDN